MDIFTLIEKNMTKKLSFLEMKHNKEYIVRFLSLPTELNLIQKVYDKNSRRYRLVHESDPIHAIKSYVRFQVVFEGNHYYIDIENIENGVRKLFPFMQRPDFLKINIKIQKNRVLRKENVWTFVEVPTSTTVN